MASLKRRIAPLPHIIRIAEQYQRLCERAVAHVTLREAIPAKKLLASAQIAPPPHPRTQNQFGQSAPLPPAQQFEQLFSIL